jgi:iron complex outermembrane receptor protein
MQYQDGKRGVAHISGKLIVNAKISYQPIKHLSIFVNARNLSNDRSVEFYKTDNIGISVYGGISFQY